MEKRNIGREGIIDDTKPLLFDKKFQELKNNEVEMQKDMKGFYDRISKDKEQGHSTVFSVNMDSFKKIINTQNSRGYTPLDYIQYNHETQRFASVEEAGLNLFTKFLCENGAEFSLYKNKSCPMEYLRINY